MPCRSRRASIAARPRTSFCFSRRASPASGGGPGGFAGRAGGGGRLRGLGFCFAAAERRGQRRLLRQSHRARGACSGLTERATPRHSARSSSLSARRPRRDTGGSPALIGGAAIRARAGHWRLGRWLGFRRRALWRRAFRRRDRDLGLMLRGDQADGPRQRHRHARAGLDRIDLARDQHGEAAGLAHAPGDPPRLIARAPVEIGARRPDDGGAGVLRHHQAAERRRRLGGLDRQVGFDEKRRAIDVQALVDRDRAPGGERHALRAERLAVLAQARRCGRTRRSGSAAAAPWRRPDWRGSSRGCDPSTSGRAAPDCARSGCGRPACRESRYGCRS